MAGNSLTEQKPLILYPHMKHRYYIWNTDEGKKSCLKRIDSNGRVQCWAPFYSNWQPSVYQACELTDKAGLFEHISRDVARKYFGKAFRAGNFIN